MASTRRRLMMGTGAKEYIEFVDPAVEAICVANWSSDGIGLTLADAAAVTSLGRVFNGNTSITSFDELQYFTGLTTITASSSSNTTGGAFYNCTALASIILPNTLTSIGKAAFRACTGLTNIIFPDSLTTLNNYAFYQCTKLAITTLNKITTCGSYAFSGDSSIVSIVAPYLVTSTGTSTTNSGTFANCSKLESIEFSSNFTTLGQRTFDNCSKLKTVVIHRSTPPSFGTNAFRNCSALTHIYVPNGYGNTYKSASGWSSFSSKIYELDANGNIPT